MRWARTFLKKFPGRTARPATARQARPAVEALESRLVPYALSGDLWPHPQLITLSFVPDGTIVGSNGVSYLRSNLVGSLTTKFGSASAWENQIFKAAQTWAQQTNINFAVVPDDGSSIGSGSYQQGDPAKGDIRISGYNFGLLSSNLAQTEMPPSINNYSVAGDVQFNTGIALNIGSTYDLYTLALHEFGHVLGLEHSTASGSPAPVMNAAYTGVHAGLTADDIAGIRAVYSNGAPRTPDAYDGAATPNSSFATAASLTPLISPTSLTAVVNNLDITTTSETEYYSVVAPAGTSGTLTLQVQSSGLSLLAPKVTVYAADQSTVLGSATATGTQGATLTVTVNGVTAGQQLYVKVAGNPAVVTGPGTQTSSVFATGAYAMTLNFGIGASPAVALPQTLTLNGNPLSAGGGLANKSGLPLPSVLSLLFNLVARDNLTAADMSPEPITAPPTGPAAAAPGSDTGNPAHAGHGHKHHHHGPQHPPAHPGLVPGGVIFQQGATAHEMHLLLSLLQDWDAVIKKPEVKGWGWWPGF